MTRFELAVDHAEDIIDLNSVDDVFRLYGIETADFAEWVVGFYIMHADLAPADMLTKFGMWMLGAGRQLALFDLAEAER